MLKTVAYIIFLCTGIFALILIFLFFRSQGGFSESQSLGGSDVVASPSRVLRQVLASEDFRRAQKSDIFGFSLYDMPVDIRSSATTRIYIFDESYSFVRKNLTLLNPVYDLSDTGEYFGKTVFLNDRTSKEIVRFVTEIDGRAVGFEVLQSAYPALKNRLLQR